MKLFTIVRNSGFGDYVGVSRAVSAILGPEYQYVVYNHLRYKNYHCNNLDFLELFYRGEYVDQNPDNIFHTSLKDLLLNKNNHESNFAITISNDDFKILSTYQKLDLSPTKNLFCYIPSENPFKGYSNPIVLHFRTTDLIGKNELIRPIIHPGKVKHFIENKIKLPSCMIICTDSKENDPITKIIQNISINNINILDRLCGKDSYLTVKTMNAMFYSDTIISKSSSFIHLFGAKKISVPSEYCISTIEEINDLINTK